MPVRLLKVFVLFQIMILTREGLGQSCFFGGYDFVGATYSEKYSLPPEKKARACEIRQTIDEKEIGKKFAENRAGILRMIIAILQEPKCSDIAPLLEEHMDKLEQQKEQFDLQTTANIKKLEQDKGKVDIQREYANLGFLNNTCNGQFNRFTSFLDLDLINRLHSAKKSIAVTKEGELVEDCSDVTASGSAELKNFKISLKKAEGETFIFGFNPYEVPDQVKISEEGEVIYDSGCFGTKDHAAGPVVLPLSKLTRSRVVDISVNWNCASTDGSGSSAWEFFLQCQQPAIASQCPLKEELIQLLKKEILILKDFMNINNHQRECFAYLYEDILTYLLKMGVIRPDQPLSRDGFCPFMDSACSKKRDERKRSELLE